MADDTQTPAPESSAVAQDAPKPPAAEGEGASAAAVPAQAPPAAQPAPGGTPAWREPAFLAKVNEWVSGKDAPKDDLTVGLLEDLRGNLGERQQTQQQAGQIEQALREAQAKVIASQGSEEALLRVLYRAQAKAAGA